MRRDTLIQYMEKVFLQLSSFLCPEYINPVVLKSLGIFLCIFNRLLRKIGLDKIPVNVIYKILKVICSSVLIIKIVGMLPHVHA